MIKHIVIWDFKEGFTEEERKKKAHEAKAILEGLKKFINGIVKLEFIIEPLSGSNGDVLLYSEFENTQDLEAYQVHPEHMKASAFIKDNFTNRRCMDFMS